MNAIRIADRMAELHFHDFDSLLQAIEDGDLDSDTFGWLSDELDPYRGLAVKEYVGVPGSKVRCPLCGLGGGRVNRGGFFTCERCDYFNWEASLPGDSEAQHWDPDHDSDDPERDFDSGDFDCGFDSIPPEDPLCLDADFDSEEPVPDLADRPEAA
jgi:hypothetical protein